MSDERLLLGRLFVRDGEGVVRMECSLDAGIDDVWAALTEPGRLAGWFGEVEGDLAENGAFRVRILLSGDRVGRVEVCRPPERLLVTLGDPDPRPGQPAQTRLEIQLHPEQTRASLVWEQRGMPVELLPAYGTGIQIHVEHLVDHLNGRELRDVEARWQELLSAYEAAEVG
ncbi:SRPBCC domain-containing protein [Conexibacter sp. DBS9H8]|uniref:SRPBCC domain-containing protein n=1 Tax=Conexibacter sp. DBS9H8 TaxID=2937801 RepID=UPI00200C42D0|nr:SRPBCC domain-containing protein [Conexibacter sp. DBS9H8]